MPAGSPHNTKMQSFASSEESGIARFWRALAEGTRPERVDRVAVVKCSLALWRHAEDESLKADLDLHRRWVEFYSGVGPAPAAAQDRECALSRALALLRRAQVNALLSGE
jgi:hypothetical protein